MKKKVFLKIYLKEAEEMVKIILPLKKMGLK